MPRHEESSQQGSFLAGFTVGLFAGAAGYFLFATKKGNQLRQQMVTEWEEATQHLADEGVIDRANISLREFVKDLFDQVITQTEEAERSLLPEERERKSIKTTLHRRKEVSKRFKGV